MGKGVCILKLIIHRFFKEFFIDNFFYIFFIFLYGNIQMVLCCFGGQHLKLTLGRLRQNRTLLQLPDRLVHTMYCVLFGLILITHLLHFSNIS